MGANVDQTRSIYVGQHRQMQVSIGLYVGQRNLFGPIYGRTCGQLGQIFRFQFELFGFVCEFFLNSDFESVFALVNVLCYKNNPKAEQIWTKKNKAKIVRCMCIHVHRRVHR